MYLSVNRGGCCHLDIENSFVIIHPLHAWKLNLPRIEIRLIKQRTMTSQRNCCWQTN